MQTKFDFNWADYFIRVNLHLGMYVTDCCITMYQGDFSIRVNQCFFYYYQLYQLGTGGRSQKDLACTMLHMHGENSQLFCNTLPTVVWEKFAVKNFRRRHAATKIKRMKYFYRWINRDSEVFSTS